MQSTTRFFLEKQVTDLFGGNYFNVCPLNNLAAFVKTLDRSAPSDWAGYLNPISAATLRGLHCVSWNDMPEDVRREVVAETTHLIQRMFTGLQVDVPNAEYAHRLLSK